MVWTSKDERGWISPPPVWKGLTDSVLVVSSPSLVNTYTTRLSFNIETCYTLMLHYVFCCLLTPWATISSHLPLSATLTLSHHLPPSATICHKLGQEEISKVLEYTECSFPWFQKETNGRSAVTLTLFNHLGSPSTTMCLHPKYYLLQCTSSQSNFMTTPTKNKTMWGFKWC